MKRLLLIAFLLLGLSFMVGPLADNQVLASAKSEVCEGIGETSAGNVCGAGGRSTINNVLRSTINLLSALAGTVAVIMLIIAGFKYITSQGDTGQIASAKNTLIYALVGVLVVALSQILVRFVLDRIL